MTLVERIEGIGNMRLVYQGFGYFVDAEEECLENLFYVVSVFPPRLCNRVAACQLTGHAEE